MNSHDLGEYLFSLLASIKNRTTVRKYCLHKGQFEHNQTDVSEAWFS
jgi:hypothetical protein